MPVRCIILLVLAALLAWSDAPLPQSDALEAMSLEELMNVKVSSVERKASPLSRSPAAVYVVTQNDIRRSGLSSIPEVLRLVPGLEVARISSHRWAISSRGFNGQYNNKLLVLLDGRSVYTPSFSGVYWDDIDTFLPDVERIEVIRGPGASVWGANAVNGVINIITKSSSETQGLLSTTQVGSDIQLQQGLRFGGKAGRKGTYRLFSTYTKRSALELQRGVSSDDQWDSARAGVRADFGNDGQTFSLIGNGFSTRENQLSYNTIVLSRMDRGPIFSESVKPYGASLSTRWTKRQSSTSEFQVQVYYDLFGRGERAVGERRQTLDFDFQNRITKSERNEIVWGAAYRYTSDRLRGSFASSFVPERKATGLYSSFVQDEIRLYGDQLYLTVGTKFEHNEYTRFEVQPSARLIWTPNKTHSVWGAVSRAVRTPSRLDSDARVLAGVNPGLLPVIILGVGNPKQKSESVIANELGYRIQPLYNLSLDTSFFYNVYDRLALAEPASPYLERQPAPAHIVQPLLFGNNMSATTKGLEATLNWRPYSRLQLSPSYSHLTMKMRLYDGASNADSYHFRTDQQSPRNQFALRSAIDLTQRVQFDLNVYRVDALRWPAVPANTRLDARFAWRLNESIEFSVGGQNLLRPRQLEFVTEGAYPNVLITRSIYARVSWGR